MADLEFSEEYNLAPSAQFESSNPKFVQLLIDWGLAKDSKSANIILVVLAIIFFSVSIYFFVQVIQGPGGGGGGVPSEGFEDPLLDPNLNP